MSKGINLFGGGGGEARFSIVTQIATPNNATAKPLAIILPKVG